MAVFNADFRLHRWSSRTRRIAFPLPGDCQLMGIRCRIFIFRGAQKLPNVSRSSSFPAERIGCGWSSLPSGPRLPASIGLAPTEMSAWLIAAFVLDGTNWKHECLHKGQMKFRWDMYRQVRANHFESFVHIHRSGLPDA